MSKLRTNEAGFTPTGLIAIVAMVVVIGGVIFLLTTLVGKHNAKTPTDSQSSSNGSASSGSTKTFTSHDGVFRVSYPKSWAVATQAANEGACGSLPCVAQTTLSPNANASVEVLETKSTSAPKTWFNTVFSPVVSDSTEVNGTAVNGYAAYHNKIVSPSYTIEHSVISHDGYIVDVYFEELTEVLNADGVTPASSNSQQDNTKYVPQYKQIVDSIKFLK